MRSYIDQVFAPLDDDHRVDRFAGGNESEVYLTDDRRYVIKIKSDMASDDVLTPLNWARFMRQAAQESVDTLGPTHSIPSYYALSRDNDGKVQILLIQPFVKDARQLFEVDYEALSKEERNRVWLRKLLEAKSRAPQEEMAQEPDIHNFELDEITVEELNQAYENGTYTARQVTQLYIDRIEDKNGNVIQQFVPITKQGINEQTSWKIPQFAIVVISKTAPPSVAATAR